MKTIPHQPLAELSINTEIGSKEVYVESHDQEGDGGNEYKYLQEASKKEWGRYLEL